MPLRRSRRAELPPTVSPEAVVAASQAMNKRHRWPMTPWLTKWNRGRGRADRDRALALTQRELAVTTEDRVAGGTPYLLIRSQRFDWQGSAEGGEPWVFYIHGGSFCWGTARDSTAMQLAGALGVEVASIEYTLSPEARFPVAIDECVAAYRALVAERGPRVLLAGVSAGGNLALGVLQRLLAEPHATPLPAAVLACTPWGDLTGSGDSYRANEGRDAYIRWKGQQDIFARAYLGAASPTDPLASPVHATWEGGLPPVMLTTGTRDLFLSDVVRIWWRMHDAGTDVELRIWEGLWHSFMSDRRLPESEQALAEITAFASTHLALTEPARR